MPDETDRAPDEALLRRYLLGGASQEEEDAVERHLFEDAGGLERIESAEADLLDACARGELDAAESARVRKLLGRGPAGRERLAFAAELVHAADGLSDTQPLPGPLSLPAPPQRPAARRPRRFGLAAGIAATLAVAVCGAWHVHQGATARRMAVNAHPPAAVPSRPGTGVPAHPPASVRPALETASFVLSLATQRGGEALRPFRVGPAIRRIELRLALDEGEEGYRTYRATVRGAAHRTVRVAEGLVPRGSASGPEIVLGIPAAELPPGRYDVAVQGERKGGEYENVAFTEFVVTS